MWFNLFLFFFTFSLPLQNPNNLCLDNHSGPLPQQRSPNATARLFENLIVRKREARWRATTYPWTVTCKSTYQPLDTYTPVTQIFVCFAVLVVVLGIFGNFCIPTSNYHTILNFFLFTFHLFIFFFIFVFHFKFNFNIVVVKRFVGMLHRTCFKTFDGKEKQP